MTAMLRMSQARHASTAEAVVAIPVKDEAGRITACLRALDQQEGCVAPEILLLLNNCTDGTGAIVRDLMPHLSAKLHVVETILTAEQANAGYARSLAMRLAAEIASPAGVLFTTDADGMVAPDWFVTNLAAIRRGADAVAGRALIDPVEAARIPAHLHEDDAVECHYGRLLDEIDCLVDPDPFDPWPRHSEHSGASIAVTFAAWRRAGGMPSPALGEDRAFFAALRRVDAVIRHAPEVQVTVSGRTDGRARGGMADTIRRRIGRQDEFVDDQLEPARDRLRRASLRAACRAAWLQRSCPPDLAHALTMRPAELIDRLSGKYFGEGWQAIEAASGVLQRRKVVRADVVAESKAAGEILVARRRTALSGRPCVGAPVIEIAA